MTRRTLRWTAARPANRVPTHPGEVLLEEFMRPLGTSQVDFGRHLGVPVQRVNEIVRGHGGVSAETAGLFSLALGTTPEYWLTLQANHDLARTRPTRNVAVLT